MARVQSLFSSEFIASGLSVEFYKFIKLVTDSRSKAEEHSHVTEELDKLSVRLGLPDVSAARMKDYLIRLLHCYMLGYSVDFGIIYAIMATQSGETPAQRRVGYLASTLFLKQNNDLGIMLINTLQRDLKSNNFLDRCAALNAICYLDHPEMQDAILDGVLSSMSYPKQIIRRKASLALYCLYKRSSDLMERADPILRGGLTDKDISMVFASLHIWKEILSVCVNVCADEEPLTRDEELIRMVNQDQDDVEQYEDLFPVFMNIMRQILEKRVPRSYTYHGVLAPWAQVACLQILGVYIKYGVGSQQETYHLVSDCLAQVERKVDAAYAIMLECIRLLGAMDSLLLESMISKTNNPFQILGGFLHSANHNLKYLGLLSFQAVDKSLWDEAWSSNSGDILVEALADCRDDDTVVEKSIELLETIMDGALLRQISEKMVEAINNMRSEAPLLQRRVSHWFADSVLKHTEMTDTWMLKTLIDTLHAVRKNLEDEYIAELCERMREEIEQEMDSTSLRECAVDHLYRLLKIHNQEEFPIAVIELAFWVLGEYSYLSTSHSQVEIMLQLQKWVMLVQDDDLQIYGLQAVKLCMQRSRKWNSGLKEVLAGLKSSPVYEKQTLAREMLGMIEDADFEKIIQSIPLPVTTGLIQLVANPNRPHHSTRFISEQSTIKPQPRKPEILSNIGGQISQRQPSPRLASSASAISHHSPHRNETSVWPSQSAVFEHPNEIPSNRVRIDRERINRTPAKMPMTTVEQSMISSLIDLELEQAISSEDDEYVDDEEPKVELTPLPLSYTPAGTVMNTETFGRLWLEYSAEHKTEVEYGSKGEISADSVGKTLTNQWGFELVQVINQEFIAAAALNEATILLHGNVVTDQDNMVVVQATFRAHRNSDLNQYLRRTLYR